MLSVPSEASSGDAKLHFDECERPATARDQINLANWKFHPSRQHRIPFQAQPYGSMSFCPPATPLGSAARRPSHLSGQVRADIRPVLVVRAAPRFRQRLV